MSRRPQRSPSPQGFALWVAALAVALSFLALDSGTRLRAIRAATDERFSEFPEPTPDVTSSSGYEFGQHRLLLPGLGVDGYHWILQAERAADANLLRLRNVDYDNAPVGREVHWAAPMRWWASATSFLYRLSNPRLPPPLALERVIPWANTLLLALLLTGATALAARGLGASAAAVFAIGCVAVYPFYEYFVAGYFDHHGLATFSSALSVLLIAAGGAGWVGKEASSERPRRTNDPGAGDRLPSPHEARRWFLGSAAAAAVSLWVSAATAVPVLLGVGAGALVSAAWVSQSALPGSSARLDAGLWRTWGIAGGLLSLLFYAIEYVPGHLGTRLEVNHPLYAVAWMAGGNLLYRACAGAARVAQARAQTAPAHRMPSATLGARVRQSARLVPELLVVAILPAAVLVAPDVTFHLADPFLWTLHTAFIVEFLSLPRHVSTMSFSEIGAGVSLVPLVALPIAGLLWHTPMGRRSTAGWRALLALVLALVLAFTFTVARGLAGAAAGAPEGAGAGTGATLVAVLATAAAAAAFLAGARAKLTVDLPERCRVAFVLLPPVLPLALSLGQVRWLGISSALWLVAGTTLAAALSRAALLRSTEGHPRSAWSRVAAAALLGVLLLPYPAFALREAVGARSRRAAYAPEQVHQLVIREVAYWLRARLGADPGVVLSSPTVTTRLIYFGGFRGIGTLYWENLDGLREAAAIYAAPSAEEVREELQAPAVTHLAFFSWDTGLESLLVAQSAQEGSPPNGTAEGFLAGLLREPPEDLTLLPTWLVPLHFPLPDAGILRGARVTLFEVGPELPREKHLARVAQYYQALRDTERAEQALLASLEVRSNVPALGALAQIQHLRGDRPAFDRTLEELRARLAEAEPLELVDHIQVIVALGLAGDLEEAARQTRAAVAAADERAIRRTPTDALGTLVGVSLHLGMDPRREPGLSLALRLLPESERASLGM